ncbi:hypothetical protein J2W92_001875 [Rhizobium leguminosarum]
MLIRTTVSALLAAAVLLGAESRSLAAPVCADYAAYPNTGPLPDELNINGFIARDGMASTSRIDAGQGLRLSPNGVVIALPFTAKEIIIKAQSTCDHVEVISISYGNIRGHLTIADISQPIDYTLGGPGLQSVMFIGGCHESTLASICATPN